MENAIWATEAVSELANIGCISGDENGLFNPGRNITREEFIKIAVTAFDMYNSDATADFTDVRQNEWYYSYIASGVESKLINGIGSGLFGVGKNISRQDASVILYRVYKNSSRKAAGEFIGFKDAETIAEYAKEAVSELSAAGIITGMADGNFCPQNDLTRAEAAVLIYRLGNIIK